MLLHASVLLGAVVLLGASFALLSPRRRLRGIVVGSAGLAAGGFASLAYTLYHFRRGVDIDFIPHEVTAQWFVSAFGWAGGLVWISLVLARWPRPEPPREEVRSNVVLFPTRPPPAPPEDSREAR